MAPLTLEPNFDMAAQFLALIAPDDEITFQTIPESPDALALPAQKQGALRRVYHGSFEEHASTLGALNVCGAGVFFMVNRGDGVVRPGARTCRTRDNVCAVRALFVDLDGASIEPVLAHTLPPAVTVESSPGKYHAYWPVEDCTLDVFSQFQQALAATFDGDPAVHDLPRVMRLAGFYHQKHRPVMSRVLNSGVPE